MAKLRYIVGRLRDQWQRHGFGACLRFITRQLFWYSSTVVYHANLTEPFSPVEWENGERLLIIRPETLNRELTSQLQGFLAEQGYEILSGIRKGTRLYVVRQRDHYLHRGCIAFGSRYNKLLGEREDVPVIGYCYTPEFARRRGLYCRSLKGAMCNLRESGYKRVVIATRLTNLPSRRGIEAAGFSFLRIVHSWVFLQTIGVLRTEIGGELRWRLVLLRPRGNHHSTYH